MGQRVGAGALTTKSYTRKVKIRDEVYELRELTIGEYDELVDRTKMKRPNPISGVEEEVPDNQALLRKMTARSTGISVAKLADLPMPVQITLGAIVNDIHFPPTDEGAKGALWEAVDDDEEDAEDKAGEG